MPRYEIVGSVLVALGRVVEDDIQPDFDALAMAGFDQRLEFVYGLPAGGISGFWREEANRVIAPVIHQLLAGFGIREVVIQLVKFKDRHQLNAVDAQFFKIGYLFDDRGEGARRFGLGRVVRREAARVHFVDDEIFQRDVELAVAFPIEVVDVRAGAIGVDAFPGAGFAPFIQPADRLGIGVEQDALGVKAMPLGWLEGTVQAEAVFNLGWVQSSTVMA